MRCLVGAERTSWRHVGQLRVFPLSLSDANHWTIHVSQKMWPHLMLPNVSLQNEWKGGRAMGDSRHGVHHRSILAYWAFSYLGCSGCNLDAPFKHFQRIVTTKHALEATGLFRPSFATCPGDVSVKRRPVFLNFTNLLKLLNFWNMRIFSTKVLLLERRTILRVQGLLITEQPGGRGFSAYH